MPQKSRTQKERAAARRETGQYKAPIAPAPIEESADNVSSMDIQVPSKPTRRSNAAMATTYSADQEFDYSYVYSDLRRIAVLAVLCFGIMIALAFLLR